MAITFACSPIHHAEMHLRLLYVCNYNRNLQYASSGSDIIIPSPLYRPLHCTRASRMSLASLSFADYQQEYYKNKTYAFARKVLCIPYIGIKIWPLDDGRHSALQLAFAAN